MKKPSALLVKKKTTVGALLNDKEKMLKENTIATWSKQEKKLQSAKFSPGTDDIWNWSNTPSLPMLKKKMDLELYRPFSESNKDRQRIKLLE